MFSIFSATSQLKDIEKSATKSKNESGGGGGITGFIIKILSLGLFIYNLAIVLATVLFEYALKNYDNCFANWFKVPKEQNPIWYIGRFTVYSIVAAICWACSSQKNAKLGVTLCICCIATWIVPFVTGLLKVYNQTWHLKHNLLFLILGGLFYIRSMTL